MSVLEAFYESETPFKDVKFDGIVGLGFSHLSLNKESNFLDMLYSQRKINHKLFSFYFNKNDLSESQIFMGGSLKDRYEGDIYYSKVISNNYWEIKLDDIYYGDKKLNLCPSPIQCTAIIDTGTSMIAGPEDVIDVLLSYSNVNKDCSNYNMLQNLKFEINGILYNLDPEFYILKASYPDIDNTTSSTCFNAFMSLNALNGFGENKRTIILGLPFLKKYYTVFDRETVQLGFAVANHS